MMEGSALADNGRAFSAGGGGEEEEQEEPFQEYNWWFICHLQMILNKFQLFRSISCSLAISGGKERERGVKVLHITWHVIISLDDQRCLLIPSSFGVSARLLLLPSRGLPVLQPEMQLDRVWWLLLTRVLGNSGGNNNNNHGGTNPSIWWYVSGARVQKHVHYK